MLKRLFGSGAGQPDELTGAAALAACRSAQGRYQELLRLLCDQLGGDTRGYIMRERSDAGFEVAAVHGYEASLAELGPQYGPWQNNKPGLSGPPKGSLKANSDSIVEQLGQLGLLDASATLTLPLEGGSSAATLVLHRHGGSFSRADLEAAWRWGALERELGKLQEANATARRSLFEFSQAFVQAAESEDYAQLGHAARVTAYAVELGRAAGLDELQLRDLYLAATLHDIGKLGSGSWEDTPGHAGRGANMLASAPLLRRATLGIRAHHERYDGQGFPDKLKGERIPLLGRIIAVADQFDLLSSERGKALPLRDVEKALKSRAGDELDPELVTLFIGILRRGRTTQDLSEQVAGLLE